MNFNYHHGTRLLLVLINDELLEGTCYLTGSDRIDLVDIVLPANGNKLRGPNSYYRPEIKSVRVLPEKRLNNSERRSNEFYENNHDDVTTSNGDDAHKPEDGNDYQSAIFIPREDFEELRNMTEKFIYIPMIDVKFYNSIKHLSTCENVGISVITTDFNQFSSISLLVLSAWDQVYIYDLLFLERKKLPEELTEILESPHILKVAHDSRLLTYTLRSQYGIELENIFDTMCADVTLQHKNNPEEEAVTNNIGECLKLYFNFPDNFVNIYKGIKTKKWDKRPLSEKRKLQASQLCSYLIYLKNHLESLMLKEFFTTCTHFSNSLHLPAKYDKEEDAKKILNIYQKCIN